VQIKIKSLEDFWAGLMFIAIGLAAVIIARDYPMGWAIRMGPGYFPTWLGGILIFLGAIITGCSFCIKGEGIGPWAFRPMFVLTGALALFGVALELLELGLVPALALLTLASGFAHKEVRWLETIVVAVLLTIGCVGLFVYGIGLSYPLFWWSA
jgi:hypothetical protein